MSESKQKSSSDVAAKKPELFCYTSVFFKVLYHQIKNVLFLCLFSMYYLCESIINLLLCLVTLLCPILWDPMDCSPPGSFVHCGSPGKNTGVGCHALLQRIFPTQGSNPGLPHCRQILYCLSHQGSPNLLQYVTIYVVVLAGYLGWHIQT